MNRTKLACCVLMASAFILAGLLLTSLNKTNLLPMARADQVLTTGPFTYMTAQTRKDEDSLFVIDSVNSRLLIIRPDVSRGGLDVVWTEDLSELFGVGGDNDRRENRRGRRF